MSDIRIDDDGFLVGDTEQQRTEAENVLMQDIKTDTTAIVNLLKGTVKLQRDALKAAQSAAKPKGNQSNNGNRGNVSPRVNLVHPNRANNANNQSQRVNLNHPNRPPANNSNVQANDAARPRIQQNQGSNTGAPTPPNNPNSDTARVNRQRDANGRFTSDNTQANDESTQGSGNRDSRGRFTGGNGSSAAERSAVSRITDSLKDLNSNLTLNADTDRIDPMVDAIKEAGSVITTGVEAGKKVLSVGNTLIAKPAMALGRGIKGLFKPKTDTINSPVAWYKRIWRTLERGNRQDQTQHNQEQRRLDELVRGQGQGGGSGNSSLLMVLGLGLAGLLSAIKNIKIPSLEDIKNKIKELGTNNESPTPIIRTPKIPTQPSLPPTRFQSWMTRLGESKVGKALGGFAKKIPYISSALEAGAGGINAVNINNDENLTDAQKERAQAANAGATTGAIGGGLGGATAGMAAGAITGAFAGPVGIAVGTVVGGLVGSWLGTEGGRIVGGAIGGWVDDLANADIAGRISNAWTAFVTPLTPMFAEIKSWTVSTWKKTQDTALGMWESVTIDAKATWSSITTSWDNLIASVSTGFESIANASTAFNTWFKEKTGIDIGENLTRSKNAVVDAASRHVVEQVVETAKGMGESLAINAKANTEKLKENAASLGQGVKDAPLVRFLGSIGEGLSGAAFALTQPTDKEKTSKSTGFTPEKAKSIKATSERLGINPNDLAQIISFETGGTFDPSQKNLSGGSARGLIQFMPSTARAMGTTTEALAAMSFDDQMLYVEKYLKGRGIGKNGKTSLPDMYDAVLGSGYKKGSKEYAANAGVDTNGNDIIEKGEAVKSKKFQQHKKQYFAVAANTAAPKTAPIPTTKVATNSVPTMKAAPVNAVPVPNVQSVQSVQAKEQPTRHNTTPTPIKVSMPKPLVGQNVSDRGIAHILTGGIGETV